MAHGMIHLFRAFSWLRWRLAINQFRSASRRDGLVRFSRFMATLTPIFMAISLLPVVLGVIAGAAFLGWGLGSGQIPQATASLVLRILLLVPVAGVLLAPLILAARAALPSVSRLLLLPIHHSRLHLMHLVSALGDPWILGSALVLLVFSLGLLTAGRPGLAGVMCLATGLLISLLTALSSWVQTSLQFLLRERRRRDLFTFLLLLLLMAGSFSMMGFDAEVLEGLPEESIFMVNVPGELYVLALEAAFSGLHGIALWYLLATALVSAGFYLLSERAWGRMLLEAGDRATAGKEKSWGRPWRIRGVSAAVVGVASVQMKTMLRTVPGKMAVLQGLFMVLLVALISRRLSSEDVEDLGGISERLGVFSEWLPLLVATMFSALALLQFGFNQFALDRAGLAREFLLPVLMRDLVLGKALGLGGVAACSLALSVVPAVLVGGMPWPTALAGGFCSFLVLLGTILALTPLAVVLSALFPRAVDFSHAFRQNQPHVVATLVGMLSIGFVLGLHGMVLMVGIRLGSWPGGTLLLGLWIWLELLAVRLLLPVVARLVWARRESILLALERD